MAHRSRLLVMLALAVWRSLILSRTTKSGRSGPSGSPAPGAPTDPEFFPPPRRGLELEALAILASVSLRAWRSLFDVTSTAALPPFYRDRQVQESVSALEEALCACLGVDYRARMQVPCAPKTTGQAGLRALGLRRRYARHVDVAYGEGGRRNCLDIWKAEHCPAGAPVLIQIPGGGWVGGSKRGQGEPLMAHMVERGWICVSINYRLGLRNAWPAAIVDVRRAIAWVKEHIGEYGGDPSFVAVTGGSAGGHLAALAALSAGDPEWQPGFEGADTSVQAVVSLYGIYDWMMTEGRDPCEVAFIERYVVHRRYRHDDTPFRNASPLHRVHAQAPPFFVLHGGRDRMVPIGPAREFVRALREVSAAPVAHAELPGAPHSFDVMPTRRTQVTVAAIGRFLAVAYGDHRRQTPGKTATAACS